MIYLLFKIRTNQFNDNISDELDNNEESKSSTSWEHDLIAFDGRELYNKSNKKDLVDKINKRLKI